MCGLLDLAREGTLWRWRSVVRLELGERDVTVEGKQEGGFGWKKSLMDSSRKNIKVRK
jgi:hypothetical protein